jgi:UDPglucose 6-dehydrogenase
MSYSYSIIGLGKLGASIAAAIASRGHRVIGVDSDARVVDAVNAGAAPVQETGLAELITANRDRLRATSSYREAILETDITFVVVPTPSNASGGFCLEHAALAFEQIGDALQDKRKYHLVALTSTVLPGATRYGLLPILQQRSKKNCGADFGLCYSPTFIALGSAIRDFLYPDFTLIGEFEEKAGCMLESAYAEILPNRIECRHMTLENAELAKISINSYVTMKITFANVLADLCERIPGGDVDAVTAAVGLDARIGAKYLTGALGYGGPCFPRDNLAFDYMARTLGTRAEMAETTDRINRAVAEAVIERAGIAITPGVKVAVLGLAYKPSSQITDESQSLMLVRELLRRGADVLAHDPLMTQLAANEFRNVMLASLDDCLHQASIVIVATPDSVYAALEPRNFISLEAVEAAGAQVTVVDCWRILSDKLTNQPGINYVALGRSTKDAANAARLAALWK